MRRSRRSSTATSAAPRSRPSSSPIALSRAGLGEDGERGTPAVSTTSASPVCALLSRSSSLRSPISAWATLAALLAGGNLRQLRADQVLGGVELRDRGALAELDVLLHVRVGDLRRPPAVLVGGGDRHHVGRRVRAERDLRLHVARRRGRAGRRPCARRSGARPAPGWSPPVASDRCWCRRSACPSAPGRAGSSETAARPWPCTPWSGGCRGRRLRPPRRPPPRRRPTSAAGVRRSSGRRHAPPRAARTSHSPCLVRSLVSRIAACRLALPLRCKRRDDTRSYPRVRAI